MEREPFAQPSPAPCPFPSPPLPELGHLVSPSPPWYWQSFSCPKHQVKTPRKVEVPPPVEGTGVCALPSRPQAEPGCPDHLWKWEIPGMGAERQLDQSSVLPSGQDIPTHPASQSAATSPQTRGYSRNRNNAPRQSCEAASPPRESKHADATRYKYRSISSVTDPQAYLQEGVSAQPSCPARQQGWARGRGAGPSPVPSSPHPTPRGSAQGSGPPGDLRHRRAATRNSHKRVAPANTGPHCQRGLEPLAAVPKTHDGSGEMSPRDGPPGWRAPAWTPPAGLWPRASPGIWEGQAAGQGTPGCPSPRQGTPHPTSRWATGPS